VQTIILRKILSFFSAPNIVGVVKLRISVLSIYTLGCGHGYFLFITYKTTIWKSKEEMEVLDRRETYCEEVNWIKLGQDHVQWLVVISATSSFGVHYLLQFISQSVSQPVSLGLAHQTCNLKSKFWKRVGSIYKHFL